MNISFLQIKYKMQTFVKDLFIGPKRMVEICLFADLSTKIFFPRALSNLHSIFLSFVIRCVSKKLPVQELLRQNSSGNAMQCRLVVFANDLLSYCLISKLCFIMSLYLIAKQSYFKAKFVSALL